MKGVKQVATKLGRIVIKQELVELTGDYKLAIVLNQMIYWSERVADYDKFIKEEKERLKAENIDSENISLQNGWIYKKADELAEECMITSSEATMRRYLDKLVEKGWLSKRNNPKYRWDKTFQYRVELHKIQIDLNQLGFALDGYAHVLNDDSKNQIDDSNFQNDDSKNQNESSNFHFDAPNFHDERAIPEITSEITSELKKEVEEEATTQSSNAYLFFEDNGFGTISPFVRDKIEYWENGMSTELVIKAMEIAVESGVRTWKYVEAVLRDWANRNLKTVEQVHAAQLAFRENRSKRQSKLKQRTTRKELIPDWLNNESEPQTSSNSESELSKEEFEKQKKELFERIKKNRGNKNG